MSNARGRRSTIGLCSFTNKPAKEAVPPNRSPMPELAVMSLIRDDQPLNAMVDFAVENDFKAIELNGRRHCAEKLSQEELDYFRGVADEHGITINLHYNHGALPGSHSASVWHETLESLKRNLEMTKNLGGKVVVLHPGKIDVPTLAAPEDGSELIRREAIRNLKRFVRHVAPVAEELGINVCIENLFHDPGYVLQSYEELASVIDDADSPNVGATIDVGHCNRGDGIPDAIRDLGERVRHLHLNDVIDGVDHHEIGTGILDLDEMEPLVAHDLNVEFATLEVGARSPDGEGIILRSRDVLRKRYGAAVG